MDRPSKNQPTAATASAAAMAYIQALPAGLVSRTTPSGVVSNTHAITSAIGKPSISTRMKTRSAQGGASKAGKPMLAPCTTSQATTR